MTWLSSLSAENIIGGPHEYLPELLTGSFLWPSEMEGDLSPISLLKGKVNSFVFFGQSFGQSAASLVRALSVDPFQYSMVAECQIDPKKVIPTEEQDGNLIFRPADRLAHWMVLQSSTSHHLTKGTRISLLNIPFSDEVWPDAIRSIYGLRRIQPKGLLARNGMAGLGLENLIKIFKEANLYPPEWLIVKESEGYDARPSDWEMTYREVKKYEAPEPFREIRKIFHLKGLSTRK